MPGQSGNRPAQKFAVPPNQATCSQAATAVRAISTRKSSFPYSSLNCCDLSLMGGLLPLPGMGMMRILIADDSTVVRDRLVTLLTDVNGIEVVGQAKDATEARNLTEELRPDVAILDIRMPKGSGADVLLDIKKLNPVPKVIILTNYPHPENKKKCIDRGADYFFDKSTEFKKVLSVLRGMIRDPATS